MFLKCVELKKEKIKRETNENSDDRQDDSVYPDGEHVYKTVTSNLQEKY